MRNKRRIVEAVAVYDDGLTTGTEVTLTAEEWREVAPLLQVASQLRRQMRPVQPSAAFVQSLGQELVDNARRQLVAGRRLRRATLLGAAAVGSLLSIASIIGAVVFVVVRMRMRTRPATA